MSNERNDRISRLLDEVIKKAKEVGSYSAKHGFDAAFLQHHAEKKLDEIKKELLSQLETP